MMKQPKRRNGSKSPRKRPATARRAIMVALFLSVGVVVMAYAMPLLLWSPGKPLEVYRGDFSPRFWHAVVNRPYTGPLVPTTSTYKTFPAVLNEDPSTHSQIGVTGGFGFSVPVSEAWSSGTYNATIGKHKWTDWQTPSFGNGSYELPPVKKPVPVTAEK